jgi:hypothetical protein
MTAPFLHSIAFAAFRLLSLYAHNTATIAWQDLLPVFAWLCAFLLGYWVVLIPILRDTHKRGTLLTATLAAYFLCVPLAGAVRTLSEHLFAADIPYRAPLTLLALGLAVAVFALWLFRTQRDLRATTKFLNVAAVCVLLVPLSQIGHQLSTRNADIPVFTAPVAPSQASTPNHPDIYYIVLDGYARADVLDKIFESNNSLLLDKFRRKGFYVADQARANYSQTYLSLASSLNGVHLTDLAEQQGESSENRWPLKHMIHNNATTAFLKERGYKFFAFSSGYAGTELRNADTFFKPEEVITEFEKTISVAFPNPIVRNKLRRGHALHRDRINFIFDTLNDLPPPADPIFVFAHILSPHPPFVFGADGAPRTPKADFALADGNQFLNHDTRESYITGYRDQAQYISDRIQETVDAIIARTPDAIIIIQGDHGSGVGLHQSSLEQTDVWERLAILNALRLPGVDQAPLYPDITPVNTFRVILNHYFGATLPMLPDESYYATWEHPYKLENVTDSAKIPHP